MDEFELYELLTSFQNSQFVALRHRLGLSAQHFRHGAAPAEVASQFIQLISQRDRGDLSELESAALAVIGRKPGPRPGAPPPIPSSAPLNSTAPAQAAETDTRPRLLVLAANPLVMTKLKLDEEAELIREALGATEGERPIRAIVAHAVKAAELSKLLLEHRPKVLHFSGHANPEGAIYLVDSVGLAQAVTAAALAGWFQAVPVEARPDCVVLNACYTNETAKALVPSVKCVVGMSRDFEDDAALAFAAGFYRGLARFGGDYRTAFKLGCAEIDLLGQPDATVPVFSTRKADELPSSRPGELTVDLIPADPRKRGSAPVNDRRIATVWFGTNRKPIDAQTGDRAFTNHRDTSLYVGKCEVHIPESHEYGSTGSSFWTRLWKGDDRLTVDSVSVLEEQTFRSELAAYLSTVPIGSRDAVVYIHGYFTTFKGAAIRAAQIGCDLGIPGLMAFYSWPSRGNFGGYVSDIEAVEASTPYLLEFLDGLRSAAGIERVHLIAHSMGNRGLLAPLGDLYGGSTPPAGAVFDEVVLAAADVDAEIFTKRSGVFLKAANRTTLYASDRDLALKSSGLIRDMNSRAGFTPPVTAVGGIDTVHVSGVDLSLLGHGYFAEAAPVLGDIHDILVNHLPAGKRNRLKPVSRPPHWEFAP
jgi:esterase/lipase superfamily enzyme